MVYTPYVWPLIIASLFCIRIALYVQRYPDAPAARSFSLMMWLGVAWTFLYGISILTVWYPLRVWLSMLMYIPTRLITPVILLLALEYTGHEKWITKRNIALLMIIPVLSIVASLTSPWHTLFRYNFHLDLDGSLPILHYDAGIIYTISIIYGPVLVFFALGLFFFSLRDKALKPNTTLLLLFGILIPVIVEVLFAFGITPIKGYNFAPSTIVLTGIVCTLALIKYELFSFAPIARSTVFENITDMVVVFDAHGHIVDCNPAALEVIGLNAETYMGVPIDVLPRVWQDFFEKSARFGEGSEEVQLDTRYGQRVYDVSIRRIHDAKNRFVGILFLLHEISALRASEQRVSQLLEEKELLLREVHHRVKNNMSVIASILSLQAETLEDSNAREALADARSRVHSMMILYERLYRSDGVSDISLLSYLSPLIDKIIMTFGNAPLIRIHKDLDDFVLNARQLFSIGIIVNELITNAMKHAFPDGSRGNVYIQGKREEDFVILSVADDGGCFPEDVAGVLEKGFGLQVVKLMSKQIAADLDVSRGEMTRFIIRFKK